MYTDEPEHNDQLPIMLLYVLMCSRNSTNTTSHELYKSPYVSGIEILITDTLSQLGKLLGITLVGPQMLSRTGQVFIVFLIRK